MHYELLQEIQYVNLASEEVKSSKKLMKILEVKIDFFLLFSV